MKTIILDDERPAVQILSMFVKKVPFLQLELATTNAFEALEILNNKKIDLLFLDIEMPDITGIELLKALSKPPMLIFTTAYEQYALQGYELDIVDCLVKPIRFSRFLKATNKAQKRYQYEQQSTNFLQEKKITDDFLFVKADYKTVKIAFDDILYIEGLKDYVKIVTKNKMLLTRLNLKGIEKKLPQTHFIRIHRSYIVAFSKITSFQKSQVTIATKNLPISDTYRDSLLKRLG